MQFTMEIIVSVFLVFGAFFMLVGSIGMVRLPDLFMRLHAPTKSSTLGLGSFLIASMIFFAFQGRFGFAELLITLLAFITAPVSANLIAQAALHLRLRSLSGEVPEAIERPLPWDRYKIGQRFSQNKPLWNLLKNKKLNQ
ncbi:Na+/H+ antiporter subunit G [Acinetobacter sp. DUT-2]|nr:Na+/H+ antiporter subunit G [Acinetobacter sp. DUT-2]